MAEQLTPEQRDLLILVGDVLDVQAGDGMGTANTHADGSTVWIDELVMRISDAFGLDPDKPLGQAIRAATLTNDGGDNA